MVDNSKLMAELENWEESVVVDSRRIHLSRYPRHGMLPSLFQDSLNIGSINYQQGNLEETRLWFAWGVRVLAEFLSDVDMSASKDHQVGVPRYAENALVRAILIGQPQLRQQAIESVQNLDPEIEESVDWDPRYHMTRLFVALATDADEEVPAIVDRLRATADDLDEGDEDWRAYFQQLATVAEAIVADDPDTVETKLAQLLDLHDDIAREEKDRTDVMDHRSGALVILARERGLQVEPVDHEYLPTDLIELVTTVEPA